MLDRRTLMLRAAVAAMLPTLRAMADPASPAEQESQELTALFDRFVNEFLHRSPETATSLGLDTGDLTALKSQLSDASLAAVARERQAGLLRLQALRAIDRGKLHATDRASYDTILFLLDVAGEAAQKFDFAGGSAFTPYILNQLTGAYYTVPDFLDTQHRIEIKEDADAYIARLEAFASVMDQELEQVRHDAALGVVPPDFVLDKTLVQMRAFLATPAEHARVVMSVADRAAAKRIAGDYRSHAASLYTGKILPALARQADFLQNLRAHAPHEAGVGRLPQGSEYYRIALKNYTTSSLSPDELHRTGLDLVAKLSADLDGALVIQGFAQGTVGQRLAALTADANFLYQNDDQGKRDLIADLNTKVAEVEAKLPLYFGALPKSRVEIRRVPPAIEAGSPTGYYQPGSLDGSRPGTYYINLRDTAEHPKWHLPTLTFHEAIPGHHVQISLANEAAHLPLIRKMQYFSGFGEGWALYAEQLAGEMGLYDHDPLGRIGQMQWALFRAVRLVVDTGIHAQGWSRERAIAYFVETVGEKRSSATTEVERYCVWPGQACSYMVGKLTWLRLRAQAKAALGAKFDVRSFHDAGLLSGALPLDVLEHVISGYIIASRP